jgi:predicted secreted protein
MSNAFTGYGLFVKVGDGATPTENFTAVNEVQTASFSGAKVDTIDVTHAQSPNRRREFIGTLIDSGELQFTANYIPQDATQLSLQALMDGALLHNWKVVLPNSLGTFSFAGLINSIDRNLDFSKEAKLTCKIKISGTVSFA